jgi:hypothetical protein
MSLDEKRRRFIEAYLIDPNATKAAIAAAGYSTRMGAAKPLIRMHGDSGRVSAPAKIKARALTTPGLRRC